MLALRRAPVVADMTLVTAGAMTANVAGYLLQLLAGRWLGVAGYSEFASLMAVQLLAAVPALALQNVVARELVRGAAVDTVRRLTRRCAVIVAVVAAALIPVVAVVLHVDVAAAGGALMAAPVLVVISGEQGILQGRHEFRWLATVLGGTAIARVAPAVIVLAVGGGAAPALWAAAIGLLVAATAANRITESAITVSSETARRDSGTGALVTGLPPGVDGFGNDAAGDRVAGEGAVGDDTPGSAALGDHGVPGYRAAGTDAARYRAAAAVGGVAKRSRSDSLRRTVDVAAVLRAAQVQAALMALSSADLIVARIVLDEADASRYALGAIATKIAFWLPQAVGVVLYPRMAQPQHSARAVRSALAVLGVIGLVAVAGAALLSPLAPLFAGADYAPIQGWLWLFALEGALLAVLQGALLSAIAADRTAPATVIWLGLAAELAITLSFVRTLPMLIATATITAATTTAVIIWIVAHSVRTRTVDEETDPAEAPLPALPHD